MNTQQDLLKRLLKLFPVSVIKSEFNIEETGTQPELISIIIEKNSAEEIKQFVVKNFSTSKQHVYIYNLEPAFTGGAIDPNSFPFEIIGIHNSVNNGVNKRVYYGLPKVTMVTTINNPFEEMDVIFYQPLQIIAEGSCLIVKATILEKNMSNYFPSERRVIDVVKNSGEDQNLSDILLTFMVEGYGYEALDIHKGIKEMLDNGRIDCKVAKWKSSYSVTSEIMDEEFTLKEKYPDRYEDLISSPMGKTVFKYKHDDGELCDHFTVEPQEGKISIAIFPAHITQVDNVINEIISGN